MQTRFLKKSAFSQQGFTLLEVMIAMLLITMILLGGVQFFFGGRTHLQKARMRRLATICLTERAEYLRQLGYSGVSDVINEYEVAVQYGSQSLWRSTIVQEIDDDLDGMGTDDADSNPVDYKNVKIVVGWLGTSPGNISATVILTEDYQP
jgi:prepilin-type N-terminal cleavage/methylation domain-containing protein